MANQSLSSTENEEKFIWDGTLENLKKFAADELKLLGKWTSHGGETKLFTSPLVSLKWQSKTSKWITISGTPVVLDRHLGVIRIIAPSRI